MVSDIMTQSQDDIKDYERLSDMSELYKTNIYIYIYIEFFPDNFVASVIWPHKLYNRSVITAEMVQTKV